MRTIRTSILLAALGLGVAAQAQFQLNPQLGITFQNLSNAPEGTEYKANVGFLIGLDGRIGDALYFQPGVFFARNATTVTSPQVDQDPNNPNATIVTEVEDGLVRSVLKLRAQLGYKLINEENFKLRFAVGPSYDVLMSVDGQNDKIEWNKGDFNDGSFNLEAGLGFDVAFLTFEPGVAFGLSRVFNDNPAVKDIDSKYFTFYFTAGIVLGKGM